MPNFSIGIMTLAFAVMLPLLWLIGHYIRRIEAYSKRQDPPTHRLGFYMPAWLLIGLIAGSFAQPLWEKAVDCRHQGQKLGPCLFIPESSR